MGYVIVALGIAYMFWFYIANADLKIEKIKTYLEGENLSYVRHRQVYEPNNPNFEIGENILTWLRFRKHQYEIDAEDSDGNPVIVQAVYYQPRSFYLKNRVYFVIKKS